MTARLVPFDGGSALLEDAVRIYAMVWGRDVDESRYFFRRHTGYPLFRGIVAVVQREVVGMAFGTESCAGQWWHNRVAEKIGPDHPALRHAWVLTELAVLAPYRNQGIGQQLHDYLVTDTPQPNLLLSTQIDNYGARRFYERLGWQYLHPGFSFQPGRQEYVIMHRQM